VEQLEQRIALSTSSSWDIATDEIYHVRYLILLNPVGGNDRHGAILRIDPGNGSTRLVSDNAINHRQVFVAPSGLTTESIDGIQYLGVVDPDGGNDGLGAILRVDPRSGATQLVSDNAIAGYKAFDHPTAITTDVIGATRYLTVLEPAGGNDGQGAIIRVDPDNGRTQLVCDNAIVGWKRFAHPSGITTESIGGIQYLGVVDPDGGNDGLGAILRVDPRSGATQLVSDNAIAGHQVFHHPTVIRTEVAQGSQYLTVLEPTGYNHGAVILIDPADGGTQLLATGGYFTRPTGMTISPQDDLIVIDPAAFGGEGALLRLESQTGNQGVAGSIIAQNGRQAQILIALADGAASAQGGSGSGKPIYYLDAHGDLFSRSASGLSLVDTNVQSYQASHAGATLEVWEKSPPGTSPQMLTATSFIAEQDIELIREQPDQFLVIYQKYASRFNSLFGPAFQGLTREGSIAAFACLVAYQLAPCRAFGDPSPPPEGLALSQLLVAPLLVCSEYCELATLLFREACPEATQDGIKLYQAGWNDWVGASSPVGNHAQLFVTGVGVPLLLDPTIGLIARADLPTIENGTPVPSAWMIRPSARIGYDPYVSGRSSSYYRGSPQDLALRHGSSARGSTSYLVWANNSFVSDVQTAIGRGLFRAAHLFCLIDTSAYTPLSGGTTDSATVGRVGHVLYVLGPGVPTSYVDQGSGVWMTLSSGLATCGVGFAVNNKGSITPLYFNVTGSDGGTWSIDLQMNAWQPGYLMIEPAATVTSLTATRRASLLGQEVTFTVQVASTVPGMGAVAGTVIFLDGSRKLGSVSLTSGVARFSASSLSVGRHRITAAFQGGVNLLASTSEALAQTVNQADTRVRLRSSVRQASPGHMVTFTATVTATPAGAGVPGGVVTFKDGARVLGTAKLRGGVAVFETSQLALGSHAITAVYAGNTSFKGRTSVVLSQNVLPGRF
jgi:hypothetical protein